MHCEYVVTYNDFKDSIRSYRKVSRAALFVYGLRVWFFPLTAALMCILSLYAYFSLNQDTFETLITMTIGALVLAILTPIGYWIRLKQTFKLRTSIVDSNVSLDFDAETIRFTIPGRVEVAYPWTSFTAYREGPLVATLFVGKAAFHTIPKRAMDEADWTELRQYVLAHARQF